jgi:hypothetical protein
MNIFRRIKEWFWPSPPNFPEILDKLVKGLSAEDYETGLPKGQPLLLEDLGLDMLGLYTEKDPEVPDDDYILTPYLSFGRPLYKRKTEEGKKWYVVQDTGIVKWPKIKKE